MQTFKIRSSGTGSIMAYPDKNELPTGAKTYVNQWIAEQLYNRTKVFTSKYTDKGNVCEDGSIDLVAERYGWGLISKNDKSFENDYLTGTPDLILSERVVDIKNSWDCFTFPLFGKLNPDYEWQVQCYMDLTGKNRASVIYTLMDAPDELVEKEAAILSYKAGYTELESDFYDEVKASMTYSHLPIELRIKRFDVEKDDKKIQQVKDRVTLCREYIKSLNISSVLPKLLAAV
jgi:hypothetical protein